jgi:hypothetical protein
MAKITAEDIGIMIDDLNAGTHADAVATEYQSESGSVE